MAGPGRKSMLRDRVFFPPSLLTSRQFRFVQLLSLRPAFRPGPPASGMGAAAEGPFMAFLSGAGAGSLRRFIPIPAASCPGFIWEAAFSEYTPGKRTGARQPRECGGADALTGLHAC